MGRSLMQNQKHPLNKVETFRYIYNQNKQFDSNVEVLFSTVLWSTAATTSFIIPRIWAGQDLLKVWQASRAVHVVLHGKVGVADFFGAVQQLCGACVLVGFVICSGCFNKITTVKQVTPIKQPQQTTKPNKKIRLWVFDIIGLIKW